MIDNFDMYIRVLYCLQDGTAWRYPASAAAAAAVTVAAAASVAQHWANIRDICSAKLDSATIGFCEMCAIRRVHLPIGATRAAGATSTNSCMYIRYIHIHRIYNHHPAVALFAFILQTHLHCIFFARTINKLEGDVRRYSLFPTNDAVNCNDQTGANARQHASIEAAYRAGKQLSRERMS